MAITHIRRSLRNGLLSLIVGSMLFVPGVSYGASTLSVNLSEAELVLYIEELTKQIAILETELVSQQRQATSEDEKEHIDIDNLEALDTSFDYDFVAQYRVADDAELVRVDRSRTRGDHEDMWDIFVDIATEDFVERYVDQFLIYDEPQSGIAAFVESKGDASSWTLGLEVSDVDLDDDESRALLVQTFVHELAHLLTLNSSEIDNTKSRRTCDTYYVGVGCLKEDAYFAAFVERFWNEEDLAHAREVARADTIEEILDIAEEYYDDNRRDFVTEYAATSPGEDIAESFMFFVLDSKPRNSRVERREKVLFFYEYEEMEEIRERILETIDEIL